MSNDPIQDQINAGAMPGVAGSAVGPREISTPPSAQFQAYQQAEPNAFQYVQEGGMGTRSRMEGMPGQSGPMSRLLYYGNNLVNEKGQIERKPYDAPKEAYAELAKMATADRIALQTELYQRNFYRGKSKPSSPLRSSLERTRNARQPLTSHSRRHWPAAEMALRCRWIPRTSR